ncbi:hypothetical protein SAMN04489724_3032 [Algoriphagus locisalis]|uniref:Uncharacterized protein n=1 Tax=Algoriphagus locisalis TaxID=305507 RepID=A0A1I7CBB3_9BACT|nr:hypothetical protein [Algoriphagus locisalis]SFT96702.1 hypothetical protein SAMN04489724_3032 [Algoriphagus locisalis]
MKKSILPFLFLIFLSVYSKGQNQSIALNSYFGVYTDIDKFIYDGAFLGNYSLGWFSYQSSAETRLSGFGGIKFFTNSTPRMTISDIGNIGIGTTNPGSWKLAVNGQIRAKEIKVETSWSDFVFYDDYKLPTLNEVENHIKEKGHLKDIPSAKEVAENGIYLGEMDSKLLRKIEELTLYIIDLRKDMDRMNLDYQKLRKNIDSLNIYKNQMHSKL